MRRISITSVLLILVLTASIFACAAGWCSQSGTSCPRPGARQACAQKKAATVMAKQLPCGPLLKATRGQCGMRTFVQFPIEAFDAFEISTPLGMASRIATRFDSLITVSSIGSPEADRGPPSS
jgi:hypothetical protein